MNDFARSSITIVLATDCVSNLFIWMAESDICIKTVQGYNPAPAY